MSITKDEVYEQESLSQVLAMKDIHLYFRILGGEPVPAGVDVEALMHRVDLWERRQIFEIADAEKGSYWWVGVLAMCIWDSWRRKATEALRAGKSWRAITTTGQSLLAFGSTFLLVIRQILFPFSPITLQPLRRVLAFTAA